jgi:hypothetical protein
VAAPPRSRGDPTAAWEFKAGNRRREHGWVHKLRLVFYEAEKIKRFDWLIYPSRLLLSSIFERASFDFFFFPSLAWV